MVAYATLAYLERSVKIAAYFTLNELMDGISN